MRCKRPQMARVNQLNSISAAKKRPLVLVGCMGSYYWDHQRLVSNTKTCWIGWTFLFFLPSTDVYFTTILRKNRVKYFWLCKIWIHLLQLIHCTDDYSIFRDWMVHESSNKLKGCKHFRILCTLYGLLCRVKNSSIWTKRSEQFIWMNEWILSAIEILVDFVTWLE